MLTALVGGIVIDGTSALPKRHCNVIVDGERIVAVTQDQDFGSDVQVVDVSGKTVMPGLIDCHQHFAPWFQWLISQQDKHLMLLASQTVYHLKGALESGVTAARDLGGLEAGFVQAVAAGLIPGPRLQTAIVIIQPTNGLLDHLPGMGFSISPQGLFTVAPGIPTPWCNGVDEARAKVREVLRYGADVIKIANSAAARNSKTKTDRRLFTQEEIEAIVDEAHAAGVMVCCHVHGAEQTLAAIRGGVDTIEHGTVLDDECVSEMVKRGTWYVPTFSIFQWHATYNKDEAYRARNKRVVESQKRSFKLALKAGVRIAMGSDSGYQVGVGPLELSMMVDAGFTAAEAIRASTQWAAECMQMDDVIGTLEAGKEADLLVLDGDPLDDVGVVSDRDKLLLVMKAGKPAYGRLTEQFSPPPLPPLRRWE